MGSDTPRTRAIGSTFQFTFILPKPANSGNTRPKNRKAVKPRHKTHADSANCETAANAAGPRLAEKQTTGTHPAYATENRQRPKEFNLNNNCRQRTMPGQLPRANCLKKHRRARRDASPDIKRCNAPAQTAKGIIQPNARRVANQPRIYHTRRGSP